MDSSSKGRATFLILLICMVTALPPIHACVPCGKPHPPQPPYHRPGPGHGQPKIPPHPKPPTHKKPPHHGGGGGGGGGGGSHPPPKSPPVVPPPVIISPPIINPPVINPPVINPPVTVPPPSTPTYPPYTGPPSGGAPGGGISPVTPAPPAAQTCPIDALKLGLCVDVLGGLVHIGLGDPVQNTCCPVLGGLLELEAAVCLCTAIRIKLLNINIFIPLALQALITCGKTPPPGFVCPPL